MTAKEFLKANYETSRSLTTDYDREDVVKAMEEYSNLQNQTIIAKYLGEQEHNAHLTGRIKELEAENARYRELMQEFVDRVDRGEVESGTGKHTLNLNKH